MPDSTMQRIRALFLGFMKFLAALTLVLLGLHAANAAAPSRSRTAIGRAGSLGRSRSKRAGSKRPG